MTAEPQEIKVNNKYSANQHMVKGRVVALNGSTAVQGIALTIRNCGCPNEKRKCS